MKKAELKKVNKKQEDLLKEQKDIIKSYKKLLKEQKDINKKLNKNVTKLNNLLESFFVDEELTDEELDYFLENFEEENEDELEVCCSEEDCTNDEENEDKLEKEE